MVAILKRSRTEEEDVVVDGEHQEQEEHRHKDKKRKVIITIHDSDSESDMSDVSDMSENDSYMSESDMSESESDMSESESDMNKSESEMSKDESSTEHKDDNVKDDKKKKQKDDNDSNIDDDSDDDSDSDDLSSDYATGRCGSCNFMVGSVGCQSAEDEGVMNNAGRCLKCLKMTCLACCKIPLDTDATEENTKDDGERILFRSADYFCGEWDTDLINDFDNCCDDFNETEFLKKTEPDVSKLERRLKEIATSYGYGDENPIYNLIEKDVDEYATYDARKFVCEKCCLHVRPVGECKA